MALVKSISGIRGTIGGRVAEGLSPVDVVRFTAAYATQRKAMIPDNKTIVVGRDARLSGEMVDQLVCGTLIGMGYDVINIGLATTPTTELAVTGLKAAGGIILTASHNPKQWNALKLLNEKGEFLDAAEGQEVPPSPSDLSPLLEGQDSSLFVILAATEVEVDRILAALASASISLKAKSIKCAPYMVFGNNKWNRYKNLDTISGQTMCKISSKTSHCRFRI